jgi:hypothetical protein
VALYTITSGQQFGAVTRRMVNMGLSLPDSVVGEGMGWYPTVHDTVARQAPDVGLSASQGAGVVAALSPNMEFENRNIKVLEQVGNVPREGWDMIAVSANRRSPAGKLMPRLPEVSAMLEETAPVLSGTYDQSLFKAHRIMSGEEWRDVLSMQTAPKTATFAHNIEDPSSLGVTIDGRSGDVVANTRRPWDFTRGISSAQTKTGVETRYETHQRAHIAARNRLVSLDPRYAGATPKDVQAALWMGGRGIERSQLTKTGMQRTDGDPRIGQPYVTPSGRPLERDSRFWEQA